MAPYEALYGRRCRSPIGWFEVGETSLLVPELIISLWKRFISWETGCKQPIVVMSYADHRRRELEFEEGDKVYLKVSPMKGVVRLGKKGKLSPRMVGDIDFQLDGLKWVSLHFWVSI